MHRVLRKINRELSPGKLYFPPEWLVLGVNNICNLHCKMCDVGVKNTGTNFYENLMGSKPINMPFELIEDVLKQTKQYFPSIKIGYAFTEPLIYPHLIPSLALASELDLFTSITTNALTLKAKARDLCEAGLNEIYISLNRSINFKAKSDKIGIKQKIVL